MTRREIRRLAGETGADPRTIDRWLQCGPVFPVTRYALEAGCAKLGLPIPPALELDAPTQTATASEV